MSLRPLVFTSRRTAAVASVAALSLTIPLFGTSPAVAVDPPASLHGDVKVVRQGLIELGSALGAAAERPELSDDLPLTDTSVRDILALDTAIGAFVDDKLSLSANKDADLGDLKDIFPEGGKVALKEADSPSDAPKDTRDWIMTVKLREARSVALSYTTDELQFGTAKLGGKLAASLDAEIRIRYDGRKATPGLRQFAVVGSSDVTTHLWTSNDGTEPGADEVQIPDFKAVDGFVELDASGKARIDSTAVLALRDPNGRKQITTEDLQFSDAADLFDTTTKPGKDDVAMTVDLSTPIADEATGTLTVGTRVGDDTTYAVPGKPQRSKELRDLTSVTRLQALTGFTQYTGAVQTLEGEVDQSFPLLDRSLSDLYSPGQQLTDLLAEQATATVVCGAADTVPPTGAPQPGESRYCQAITTSFEPKTGSTITWDSPDAGVSFEGSAAGTVGRSPTKNIEVKKGDGFPTLTVDFVAADGTKHRARSAISSIQDLSQAIAALGLDGGITFDADKKSLEVAVQQQGDDPNPDGTSTTTGGNGNLAPLTGLSGLCEAAKTADDMPRECVPTGDQLGGTVTPQKGSAKVKADGRKFDATFGIGLPPEVEAAAGQPAPVDPTFYLVPGDDGVVYEVGSASVTVPQGAKMVARIGFLQADVDITTYSVDKDGKAASVSVPTSDVPLPSKENVGNAVTLRDLLTPTSAAVKGIDAKRGLKAKATLDVKASYQSKNVRPIDANGTVDATWSTLVPDRLPTVDVSADYAKLRLLDIAPARQAVMTEGSGNGTIKDAGADFVKQFVISGTSDADRTVTRALYDLGVEGSSSTICSEFVVVSKTELQCKRGPLADKGVAEAGHPYLIDGDQDALRDILIDDLAAVLNTFESPDPSLKAGRTFPLVNVVPGEISAGRNGIGATLHEMREKIAPKAAPGTVEPPHPVDVSSMQSFSREFNKVLDTVVGGQDHIDPDPDNTSDLGFRLDTSGANPRLVLDTQLFTLGDRSAEMRVADGPSEVKVVGGVDDKGLEKGVRLPIAVKSQAKIVLGVNLADATSVVRADSGTVEEITDVVKNGDDVQRLLAGKPTDYGSARVKSGDKSGVSVGLGVQSVTSPKGSTGTWLSIDALRSEMEQVRSRSGAAQDCGLTKTVADASAVAACLKLPIVSDPTTAPVEVALRADETSNGSGGDMKAQPIAYRFVAEGLSGLSQTLTDALDGDQVLLDSSGKQSASGTVPLSLPLVGTNLDAGGDVPADIKSFVATARDAMQKVEGDVKDTDKISLLKTKLSERLTGLSDSKVTIVSATPSLVCSGTCGDDDLVSKVNDVEIALSLKGKDTTTADVPFQVGPAGAKVATTSKVPASASWTLTATVGVTRGSGAYLRLPAADPAKPMLSVKVNSKLGTDKQGTTAKTCHDWRRSKTWREKVNAAKASGAQDITSSDVPDAPSDSSQCVDAYVGKFPSVLVDKEVGGSDGTYLDATVKVDFVPPASATGGKVSLPALYDGKVTSTTTVAGKGRVSTYFESFAGEAGFIDVVGTLLLDWSNGTYDSEGLQYGNLKLDVGTLRDAVLPGFEKALSWLAPLNPAVDQLSKPIPVVSDISQLAGKGPTTMLSLLQSKSGSPITVVLNLLQLQNVVVPKDPKSSDPDLRDIAANDISGFKVSPAKIELGGCTETGTVDGKEYKRETGGKGDSGRCKRSTLDKLGKGKLDADAKGTKIDKISTKTPYFSLPSVSLPILQDTSQIFGLLQDTGDATLLYVDLGHAGAKAKVTRTFGPFALGPIPVTALIGGEIAFDGRFAFGFDTRGLSRKIDSFSTGDVGEFEEMVAADQKPKLFSDGFFIDDLENGVDVPEIKLAFTVTAGAAISIGIISVGVNGGATLDLSLDAFDPNGDGKIYTDEFAGTARGPSCAFNVSSGISFSLSFFVLIDFLFYTLYEEYTPLKSPRIKLFDINCETETPVLAVPETVAAKDASGKDITKSQLVLTMGNRASDRKAFQDGTNISEKYTVRQVGKPYTTSDGSKKVLMQVSAFNLVQNYEVPEGTTIVADGGSGSDTIRAFAMPAITENAKGEPEMLGPDDEGYVAPVFDSAVEADGGAAADTIETANGNDVVNGADGDDSIRSGAGNDRVTGGAGNDVIDGDLGRDVLLGGPDDDRVNGGPGADEVRGEGGKDVVDGGVGADRRGQFPTASADTIRPLLDSGDLVVGGDGADKVAGGDGSDVVVGGEYATDRAAFAATGSTSVLAINEVKAQVALDIDDIDTVVLPSPEVVAAQCAESGSATEVGPDDVTGGGDGDVVMGGAGSDQLSGGGGDDRVCGRAGDDLLDGDGTDVDEELQGDDIVRGGPGRDRLYGSAGTDDLKGDADDDLVRGGDGDDAIAGGPGSDLLLGEAGIDAVDGDNAAGSTELPSSAADDAFSGRLVTCSDTTSIVGGGIDLDGDLAANDTGQLEGMSVVDGLAENASGTPFSGVVRDNVFIDGRVDLNGNGTIEPRTETSRGDTGPVNLAGITGAGGNGDCILGGDEVDSRLAGGAGADYVDAGAGDDSNVMGGSGNDLVRGGLGNDIVRGDDGKDLVAGDKGDDVLFGNADADVLRGGGGADLLAGGGDTAGAPDANDEVLGDGGDDVVLGGNAKLARMTAAEVKADDKKPVDDQTAIRGADVTLLAPAPGAATVDDDGVEDQVYGGVGDDWVFAQEGDDHAFGGPGADVVEGGPGSDRVQGDDQRDLVIGGSSTTGAVLKGRTAVGAPDGDDTIYGDAGVDGQDDADVMAGDNARLQVDTSATRTRWQRIRSDVAVELFDVPLASKPAPKAGSSGADTMVGGGEADLVLGQTGADVIDAGDGDDAVEGGAGKDVVRGGAGADEIVGGSWTPATEDDADDLSGGDGKDVLIGDNGNPANGFSLFVTLLDAPAPGAATPAGLGAGDTISGGNGDDRLFGQKGGDVLDGDDGTDVLEGDAGQDTLRGGSGDDVLTGGSSSRDGVISPARDGSGQLDERDEMSGGSGDDVLAGDNARLDATGERRLDGTSLRSVQLFDLATAAKNAAAGTGGNDAVSGDEGRDLLFGQGGPDSLAGGSDVDYLEGNDGADDLSGGTGEDDLVGGGSSRTGAVITTSGGSIVDRLLTAPPGLTDVTASGLLDGNDTLDGGDARDVLLGDNGRVTRGGPLALLGGGASGPHAVRKVAMADKVPGAWSGSDRLLGGQGDDDLYGQFDNTRTKRPGQSLGTISVPGDALFGGVGDDALVGDQGVDVPTPAAALGAVSRTVKDKKSFVRELVRPRGSLVRVVTTTHARQGGDDLLVGDDGADSVHAGAGKDVVNAGSGKDVVFGGDGNDALWGGADHDRLFGGEGNDLLDVKRRSSDSALWKAAAPGADSDGRRRTTNGGDLLYGGSGADGLQADEGDVTGGKRVQGDRLIDWRGKVNVFKACRTGRGTGKIMDESSSSMVKALRDIAKASGAVGSSELAIPFGERVRSYPGRPGFVCETR
jgi:Ca2+-binding RTX toxin-like protein